MYPIRLVGADELGQVVSRAFSNTAAVKRPVSSKYGKNATQRVKTRGETVGFHHADGAEIHMTGFVAAR
jgi:hypothetical protein